MDFKELNNGVKMPIQGFGVFQIPDATECERVVTDALAVGYRLIDTASVYGNERAVGMAIRKSGIPREELFITTKAWISEMGYERTLRALDTSLARLGLDYRSRDQAKQLPRPAERSVRLSAWHAQWKAVVFHHLITYSLPLPPLYRNHVADA